MAKELIEFLLESLVFIANSHIFPGIFPYNNIVQKGWKYIFVRLPVCSLVSFCMSVEEEPLLHKFCMWPLFKGGGSLKKPFLCFCFESCLQICQLPSKLYSVILQWLLSHHGQEIATLSNFISSGTLSVFSHILHWGVSIRGGINFFEI